MKSVLKALDILEAFSDEEYTLGVTDLSRRLGINKATVHNLLTTLKSRGYIEENPETRRYNLGVKALELSRVVRANIEIRDQAIPLLRELAKYSSEAIYLAILYDRHSVYIHAIEASGRPISHSAIGERVPLHCTAVGKAKMAFLPETEIDEVARVVGLARFTPNTIVDLAQLKVELERTRERGYAIDNEEHEVAIRCIAAPIFSETGDVVAACSVSGPSGRMTDERFRELAPEVRRIADAISRRLGHSEGPGMGR
ncbi:MAG: IclR family transcriptional regulator [Anaerolineales bacterium]|nr:IclR family transcriptional regulator [Anaerolineales bacterium]